MYKNQLHLYALTTSYQEKKKNSIYNNNKTINYLEINLTKYMKDTYTENYNTLMKYIEEDT